MKLLSRSEEMVLLAIWKLPGNAYGVSIRNLVSELTGHDWTLGAIYVPLDKLTRREFVKKYMSHPTANRGGRRKCLYDLTDGGIKALKEIRDIQRALWKDLPELSFERSY